MNKFDDYLKNKSIQEINEFNLPKSFDDKIEKTLANLDKEMKVSYWYKNKKLWVTVACFVFICVAGISSKEILNLNENRTKSIVKNSNNKNNERNNICYDSAIPEETSENSKMIKMEDNFNNKREASQFIGNEKDKIIKNAYDWLDDYSKSSIIKWQEANIESFEAQEKYLIVAKNETIDINGIDTYKVIFKTNDDEILGPICIYIDVRSLEVLGCDFRM